MHRRKFMKILGLGAVTGVVATQLPASSAMPTPSLPAQALQVTEPDQPFECQVESECNVDRGPNANPYVTTRADIGLIKLSDLKRRRV